MKYCLFLDEIEERDEGNSFITIETFIPKNSDEKQILINRLTELIGRIQERY